ncbi:MAG: hypothetical protein ACU85E_06255 [Gammaproteobacteria bacterium]
MRFITRGLSMLLIALALVSCKKVLKPEELPAHIAVGGTYYTQFVIRYEKGTHLTTNFRRGASIPVNTPVKLMNMTNKTIEVEVDNSSQKLLVKNVEKHTGDDVYQAFDKLFAKQKVELTKFNRLERQHIDRGTVADGMRKKAVTVAIGYPPVTETPNLDSNLWVYWSGRFNRFNVHFKNGKVSRVED